MELLAIVEVHPDQRVLCQEPGCGHGVYKRIHVVLDGEQLLVLGSTCYAKRYEGAESDKATYGGADGRMLTATERELLQNNTAELIAQFEREQLAARQRQIEQAEQHAKQVAQSIAKLDALRRRAWANTHGVASIPAMPWSWVKPLSSVALFALKDETQWVRAQDAKGQHYLMPWPHFEGWDEYLPAHLGVPAHDLGGYLIRDLVGTVSFLRTHALWDRVGSWRDVSAPASAINQSSKP